MTGLPSCPASIVGNHGDRAARRHGLTFGYFSHPFADTPAQPCYTMGVVVLPNRSSKRTIP